MSFPSAITYAEHASFPEHYQFPQDDRKPPKIKPRADQFAKTVKTLERIISVKPDNRMSGTKPVPPVTASFALNVLHRVADTDTPEPEVSVGEFGDVCFQWGCDRVILKLQIVRPNDVNFSYVDLASDEEKKTHLSNDFSSVEECIRQLC
ncbi:hypothetical protein [Teredinibacter sp. KSP-S5-2]|uniref:hypothetical protein n=1 Tax=Teredinibacter sp. KSP-S5-2 TaxID=3034506 RepID=UPI002934277D|nr:hypothetical protein [Teredinibacter sp. KSP-S5-2]WNO08900.1 hypothetical protein P5V12_18290 [Teredinibacter sp. KSP-S5-2]